MTIRPFRPAHQALAATLALALLGALAGCASLDPLQRKQGFEESHKRFTQYVRWGKISQASHFVEPELRNEFLGMTPELTQMRFTDYEILHADIDGSWKTATVDVRISGYRLNHPVERSHVLTEEWRRDGGAWLVSLDMSALREAIAPGAR